MSKAHPKIHDALNLDGDSETLRAYYANWATKYDEDVAQEAYVAPQLVVHLFEVVNELGNAVSIMDAGCGTGLVGEVLVQSGYVRLDGFDLSADMVALAKKRAIYQNLRSDVDLTQPLTMYAQKSYDVVFCTGVFTLGHVPPSSLQMLFDLTKVGGIVLTSTRTSYYEEYGYETAVNTYITENKIKLLGRIWNAPYTTDGNAHYWAYQVLK